MKYTLFFSLIIAFCNICSYGQLLKTEFNSGELSESSETVDSAFIDWTDEDFEKYSDSIKAVLYPEVIPCGIDDAELAHLKVPEKLPSSGGMRINPKVPTSIAVDKTKAVGQIPIVSGVSPIGSRTYSIPIEVSQGMHGLEPSLSLSYDSSQGKSQLGVGWYLAGLSRISRVSRNIYFDSKTDGIRMNQDDAFALDGVRLIKLSSESGFNLYESTQGNIKVKGYIVSNDIRYFEVFYPDGKVAIMGKTDATSSDLYYPITSLTDLYGNTITYSYDWGNFHRINKISYNGASVEFKYLTRTNPILSYIGGRKLEENKLLSEIEIKLGNQLLGKYSLSYTIENSNSLLSKISYSAAGEEFNPIKCYYGYGTIGGDNYDESVTQLLEWYESEDPEMIKVVKGKFDYDAGADGLIVCPNKNPYWRHYQPGTISSHSKKRYYNLYEGDEKIFLYAGLKGTFASPMPNLLTEEGFIDIFCADIDGMQEENIIKVNNNVVNGKDRVTFKVYRAHTTGMALRYTRNYDFSTIYTDKRDYESPQPKFYYTGDFNGDGKMEVLAIAEHQPFDDTDLPSQCYVFDLSGNKILYSGKVCDYEIELIGTENPDAKSTSNNSDRFLVFDYDGDGKTDLCHINKNGTDIYTFDISASGMTPRKIVTYSLIKRSTLEDRKVLLGEFNGDGLVDLLVTPPSGNNTLNTWTIYNSKGNGVFDSVNFNSFINDSDGDDYIGFVTQDVNGDGLTDLIKYQNDRFDTRLVKPNNLNGGAVEECYDATEENSIIVPINISSRNRFSQLLALKYGKVRKYSYKRDEGVEYLMTGMANSMGLIEHTHYSKINIDGSDSDFYSKDWDATFPYVNIQEPLAVVEPTQTYLNGEIVDNSRFEYSNAVLHRQGLGFCGFSEIWSYDSRDRWSCREYDPYRYGVMTGELSATGNKSYTYNVNIAANKIAKITLSKSIERDLLTGMSATTSYTYDTYGYPIKETTTYSDGIVRTITSSYGNSTDISGTGGDGYSLGFLVEQEKSMANGSSTYSERFKIVAASKRQPSVKLNFVNGQQTKESIWMYNSNGNATSFTEKLYTSAVPHKTSYEYDTYGHVTKVVDSKGLSNTFSYDVNGRMSKRTDHYGASTTYSYDAFGRDDETLYPDGSIKSVEYAWGSGNSDGRLYSIKQEETGQGAETTVYDARNRVVRRCVETFVSDHCPDGISCVDIEYDAYGNKSKESLPFSEAIGGVKLWRHYEYDQHDRLTSVTEDMDATDSSIPVFNARTSEYSYSGNSVTTVESNITTTRNYDSQGNLISVTDPGGTITYSVDPDGNPSSVDVLGEATITISYDNYRRRLSLNDPGHGITSYEYDSAGNLSKETDAKGNVTSYKYDGFNRLIEVSVPEFKTVYSYNAYDDLAKIQSDNGTAKTFTYDTYGRLSSLKEEVGGGKWLLKEYTYSDGNINSIKYTSQLGVLTTEKITYSRGCLSEVKLDDGTSIYQLKRMMPNGCVSRYATVEIDHQLDYKPDGTPRSRVAYLPRSGNKWQTVNSSSTFFNPATNNLIMRSQAGNSNYEMFEYDELNRLISSYKDSVSYQDNGNLLRRSTVGEFGYNHPTNPFAITDAVPVSGAMDNSALDVSYYSFDRPKQIDSSGKRMKYIYNSDYNRVKSEYSVNGKVSRSRYYIGGCYECDSIGAEVEKLYLDGGYYGSSVMLVKIPALGHKTLTYILRDYLGSVTGLVNADYTLAAQYSYTAWGQFRNPSTWNVVSAPEYDGLGRGYCGHEYLPEFGLINMNARLYDPALGRFLSPDPYVQFPDFSQSYNRYSYALNNPMLYVDENGEFLHVLFCAGLGGLGNLIWKACSGQIHNFGDGLAAFAIGAAAGAVGSFTGGLAFGVAGGGTLGVGGFFCRGCKWSRGNDDIHAHTKRVE